MGWPFQVDVFPNVTLLLVLCVCACVYQRLAVLLVAALLVKLQCFLQERSLRLAKRMRSTAASEGDEAADKVLKV